MRVGRVHYGGMARVDTPRQRRPEAWHGFFLATMYALGHASLVVALGILAIWFGTLLPHWIDPLMGRIVGLTLLFLGVWIIYSLVRYGRDFRLQSRWMVLIALARNGLARLRSRITGEPAAHHHEITQYGPGTAFGIGVLHGIGAETGSQALLLAGAVGATAQTTGTALLLFFALGLLMSNSLIAAFSAFGFVSSSARRTVYLAFGIFAAVFSLIVGFLFVTGQESALPDLEVLLNRLF
jgi:cytochrome c biogenesis protein CcdA